MIALSESVQVALVTGLCGLCAAIVPTILVVVTKRENKRDHDANMGAIKLLQQHVSLTHTVASETRDDVRDIKGTLADHADRIKTLEGSDA